MVKYFKMFDDEAEALNEIFFREMRVNDAYRNEQNAAEMLEATGQKCFDECSEDGGKNKTLITELGKIVAMKKFAEARTNEAAGYYYHGIELYVRLRSREGKQLTSTEINKLMERTELGKEIWKRASGEAAEIRKYLEEVFHED